MRLSELAGPEADRRLAALEARWARGGLPGFDDAAAYLEVLLALGEYARARTQVGQWQAQDRHNAHLAYHYARFLAHEDESAGLQWLEQQSRLHRTDPNWGVVLARLQMEFGRHAAGLDTLGELLDRTSGWPHLFSTYAFQAMYAPGVDPVRTLALLKQWAPRHFGTPPLVSLPVSKRPRYNIGLVCGNFRRHPISTYLLPLLAGLDRRNFMVVAYSSCAQPDEVTRELQKQCDLWYDTAGMADPELLSLIRSDRMDVLIDLDNHSHPNRLWVFAQRAAPIQVTAYGYNISSALVQMDYRLSDAIVDPLQHAPHYTEKLLHTRGGHVSCMGTSLSAVPAPMGSNACLTFGSFNDWKKIDAAQLERWSALLQACPDSRLKVVGFADGLARQRLQRWLMQSGIDPARVSVAGRLAPREFYAEIQSVDLAIDSWPFGGGVTTATTLSLGVPVLTALGPRAPSRVSASMLGELGLDRYIVASPDQLAARAAEICADPEGMSADRARVAERFSATIGNGARLATEVGELLIRAIERYRKGKRAEHDAL